MEGGAGYVQVHVSGLPPECGEDAEVEAALQRALSDLSPSSVAADDREAVHAAFLSCAVVRSKDTGECKGYCFLTFEVAAQAEAAIRVLNAGVEVAGAEVRAQLSRPKERHTKTVRPAEDLHDLRIHRQRYAGASKKKQHGHLSCSNKSSTVTRWTGEINAAAGTRGGKPLVLDDSKSSSRSGFDYAR